MLGVVNINEHVSPEPDVCSVFFSRYKKQDVQRCKIWFSILVFPALGLS